MELVAPVVHMDNKDVSNRLIKYYDSNWRPCPADEAVRGELCEYDDNGMLIMSHLFKVLTNTDWEDGETI